MPKRFTDKNKWDDEWYSLLDNDSKIVWEYLLDRCDHAGVGKLNMRMINFCCNVAWEQSKIESIFQTRLIFKVNFYFIPKYLKFQYPKGLNSKKPAIVSVRNILKEKGLYDYVSDLYGNEYLMIKEPLGNGYITIKDKDKDKDKDTDKDKDKSGFLCFEDSWKDYPGTKREATTEFEDLKKVHSDWESQLDLLSEGVAKQIEWRRDCNGEFRPAWKNLKSWLAGRHWEDVISDPEAKEKDCITCGASYADGHKYGINKRTNIKEYKCEECRART
jgi:hypothetical protein